MKQEGFVDLASIAGLTSDPGFHQRLNGYVQCTHVANIYMLESDILNPL